MSQNPAHSRKRRFPISLVMIVRDEEANLGRCLASVQGLVEEIVVVDTGSADGTVAVAESYGAKVSHFTWVDDFAAARNFALARASNPWRLVLDADEWLADPEAAGAILDQVGTQVPTFVGEIEMLQLDETTGRLRDTATFPLPRLLPRQVEYTGRVHEQLTPELATLSIGLLVGHDGYTAAANARKDGRNIALLQAAIADEPANPYFWFQLGSDHFARGRHPEALDPLVQAYNLLHPLMDGVVDPNPSELRPWWHLVTMRLMLTLGALGRYEEAVALGEQEAPAWLDSADFFLVFGNAIQALSRAVLGTDPARADMLLTTAVGCWLNAVEQGDKASQVSALKERGSVLAARQLVDFYESIGRSLDAARYRALALGTEPAAVAV